MVSDIMTLFSPERIQFVQELESKKRVFDTLAHLLSHKTNFSQNTVFDHLIEREKLGSTALGKGVSLPRARAQLNRPYAALLLLNEGILIDSPDKQLTTVFIALLLPENEPQASTELIAELITRFTTRPIANELAETSEAEIALNYLETLLQQPQLS